jgi:histone-lysine N-methyltransferase SETMAR
MVLHWDNAPAHTAATFQEYLVAKGVKTLRHPPDSPDLAPADFFLFPRVKTELAGLSMNQETFQKSWEGVVRTIPKEDFATAFRQWMERCEKCVRIGGDNVKKSPKLISFVVISPDTFDSEHTSYIFAEENTSIKP